MNKVARHLLLILIICPFSFLKAGDHSILEFGAILFSPSNQAAAIQSAIDQVHDEGGGKVIIPKGEFVSGSIVLKSNVELHLEKGAILKGSIKPEDYRSIRRWQALILANEATNIGISGKGEIDGRGGILALKIDSLFYAGKIDSSQYEFKEKRPKVTVRPQIIELVNCSKIKINDITIRNSASWVQTYFRCEELLIEGIEVDSDTYWNNDGIDIIDCKLVKILNCKINASDDGICLKSYYSGISEERIERKGCDSILISKCKIRSSANAIKLGTSSYWGFKNIEIRDIKIFDTFRSAIALESVHNGMLENILIENIKAKNTGNAFFIRLAGTEDPDRSGTLKNVVIRNMKVNIPLGSPDLKYKIRGPAVPYFQNTVPASITGLPGKTVEEIRLENIRINYPGNAIPTYANLPLDRLEQIPEMPEAYPEFSMFGELPAWALYIRHAKNINISNLKISLKNNDYRPAIVLDDVKDASIEAIKIKGDQKEQFIFMNDSQEIQLEDSITD